MGLGLGLGLDVDWITRREKEESVNGPHIEKGCEYREATDVIGRGSGRLLEPLETDY